MNERAKQIIENAEKTDAIAQSKWRKEYREQQRKLYNMKKIKIKLEKFDYIFELLPSIYWYKQSYRKRYGRGAVVFAWMKWGVVIHIDKMVL
jgi:hypothetical protein